MLRDAVKKHVWFFADADALVEVRVGKSLRTLYNILLDAIYGIVQ